MTAARDPRLLDLLAKRTPVYEIDVQWRSTLHLACYLGVADLPDVVPYLDQLRSGCRKTR